MNIILMGFKGVGKTTYGKLLAKKLHWKFLDTDDLIIDAYFKESGSRKPAHQIHQELKEEGFRKLEERVLEKLNLDKAVLSVGGGTILNPSCCKMLQKIGRIVYLSLSKEVIRFYLKKGRLPSYLDPKDFEGSFEKMHQARLPIFQKLADVTLELDQLSESEIIEKLEGIALSD